MLVIHADWTKSISERQTKCNEKYFMLLSA